MAKHIVFVVAVITMLIDSPQSASILGDELFQHVNTAQPHVTQLAFSPYYLPTSLDNLRYFPNLRSLKIPSGHNIKSLVPLIAVAKSLTSLQLNCLGRPTAIGEDGAENLSLDLLGELTQLSTLKIEELGVNSSIKSLTSLRHLKFLSLRHSIFIKDLDKVGALPQLEKLNLYGGFFRSDQDNTLDFLNGNRKLTYLNIGCSDSIHELSPVFNLTKLNTLLLGHTDYYLDSLDGIENLQDLEVLDVGSLIFDLPLVNNEVNESKMKPLKKLKNLHTIAYCGVEFDLPKDWDIRKVLPQVSTVKDHIESSNQDWD